MVVLEWIEQVVLLKAGKQATMKYEFSASASDSQYSDRHIWYMCGRFNFLCIEFSFQFGKIIIIPGTLKFLTSNKRAWRRLNHVRVGVDGWIDGLSGFS